MTDRELMQMALDALEQVQEADTAGATPKMVMEARKLYEPTITALRAALAQPKQEPVGTVYDAYDTTGIEWNCKDAPAIGTLLYTAPPQREERNT